MAGTATGEHSAAKTEQEHRAVSARNRFWGPPATALATLTCWGTGTAGVVLALWAVPLLAAATDTPPDERTALAITAGVVLVLVTALSLLLQFVARLAGDRTPWRTSFALLLLSVPAGGYAVTLEDRTLLIAVAVATAVGAFVLTHWRVKGRHLVWRAPLALVGYLGLVIGLALALPEGEQLWRNNVTGHELEYDAVLLDHPDWELTSAEHHTTIDEFHAVHTHSSDGTEVRVTTYSGGLAPTHACAEAEGTVCQEVDVMAVRMSEDDPDEVDNVRLRTEDEAGLVELSWREHAHDATSLQELARHLRPADLDDAAELNRLVG